MKSQEWNDLSEKHEHALHLAHGDRRRTQGLHQVNGLALELMMSANMLCPYGLMSTQVFSTGGFTMEKEAKEPLVS